MRRELIAALDVLKASPVNGYGFHELSPDQVETIRSALSPKIPKLTDRLPEYLSSRVYGDELQINVPLLSVIQLLLVEMDAEDIVEAVTQRGEVFNVFVDRVTEWAHTLEIPERVKLQKKLGGMLFEMQLARLSHQVMNIERAAAERHEWHDWAQEIVNLLNSDPKDPDTALRIAEALKHESRPPYHGSDETKIHGRIWKEAGEPWREWMKAQLQSTLSAPFHNATAILNMVHDAFMEGAGCASDHVDSADMENLWIFSAAKAAAGEWARDPSKSYQARVLDWLLETFGPEISNDKVERNHRFLEEALELVQAMGCTKDEALQLVDYVFGRPEGQPAQEVGGVLVCLAALCSAADISMEKAAEDELTRIWTMVEKIRAKQAAKPKFSPLPGAV